MRLFTSGYALVVRRPNLNTASFNTMSSKGNLSAVLRKVDDLVLVRLKLIRKFCAFLDVLFAFDNFFRWDNDALFGLQEERPIPQPGEGGRYYVWELFPNFFPWMGDPLSANCQPRLQECNSRFCKFFLLSKVREKRPTRWGVAGRSYLIS